MNYIWIAIVIFATVASCKNKAVSNIATEPLVVGVIPVVFDEILTDVTHTDTINVANFEFDQSVFDFGEVMEGEIITHAFSFANVGNVPLVILNAKSTCGCTVPKWSNEAIDLGQKGSIEVSFDTNEKTQYQTKKITITANTHPSQTFVYLKGLVIPKNDNSSTD